MYPCLVCVVLWLILYKSWSLNTIQFIEQIPSKYSNLFRISLQLVCLKVSGENGWPAFCDVLVKLTSLLSSKTEIKLEVGLFNFHPAANLPLEYANLIRKMQIDDFREEFEPDNLQKVIQNFPNLKEICLDEMTVSLRTELVRAKNLKTVFIYSIEPSKFLRVLQGRDKKLPLFPTVEKLIVYFQSRDEFILVPGFIQTHFPNLMLLELSIYSHSSSYLHWYSGN